MTIMQEALLSKVCVGKLVIATKATEPVGPERWRRWQLQMIWTIALLQTSRAVNVPGTKHSMAASNSFDASAIHGMAKHQWATEAAAVTIQFQINNGLPLFKL